MVGPVERLKSLSWKSRFPGLDNPTLYIEIVREGHAAPLRTKSMHASDLGWEAVGWRWYERLVLWVPSLTSLHLTLTVQFVVPKSM